MGVARREAGNLAEIRYQLRLRCLQRACITSTLGRSRTRADRPRARSGSSPRRCSTPIPGGATAAPAHGAVRADRVGHPHQRAGRDAGVRLPLPRQLQPAAGAVAADLCDDARPAPALACGGLARAACDPGAPLVARRQPPPPEPEPEPTPLERAIALVEWSLARDNGAERRAASTLSRRSWTWWSRTAWPTGHESPPGRRRLRRPARRSESSRS